MIRIGLIGTGATTSIAHFHALGYRKDPRCTVSAVYDIRPEAAGKWVEDHGLNAVVCRSPEELLERCDAVDICTPNFLHYTYARTAILSGKDVFIEKPMAVTPEECEDLLSLSRTHGGHQMVGLVYRFVGGIQAARRLVAEEIGPVYSMTSWTGGRRLANPTIPLEWRMKRSLSGSGALADFGSHLIDIAAHVAGQKITAVSCLSDTRIPFRSGPDGTDAPVENDDLSALLAETTNGLHTMNMSRIGSDEMMFTVTGEGGMVQFHLRRPEQLLYWKKDPWGAYAPSPTFLPIAPETYYETWFDREMACFLDVLEGRETVYPGIAEGMYISRVLAAAERSAAERRVVSV